jgi:hypothetical protein
MSFEAQSKLAKSKKKAYSVNSTFKKNRIDYAPGTPQYGNFGADKHLGVGVSAAYASEDGYSLQVNPYTGDTEMFVRGTTFKGYGREWASNVLESDIVKYGFGGPYKYLSKHSQNKRESHAKHLSDIARKNGVKVIYGHSRGATIVADMDVPGASRVGLDGAFIIANRHKTGGMVNYRQRQGFDALIGMKAPKTVVKKGWVPIWKKKYHSVWK